MGEFKGGLARVRIDKECRILLAQDYILIVNHGVVFRGTQEFHFNGKTLQIFGLPKSQLDNPCKLWRRQRNVLDLAVMAIHSLLSCNASLDCVAGPPGGERSGTEVGIAVLHASRR